jgi:hypothetical protein
VPREPFVRWEDIVSGERLLRAMPPLLLLLAFRIQFGSLLSVGMQRVEWRFLAFHLATGLLIGAGLAWMRGERGPGRWAAWCATGLAGGLLAEALEVWFTYRHLMGTLTFYAWQWFELPPTPALVYQILQGLRAGGLFLPLLLLAWWGEKRFGSMLFMLALVLLAVWLRVPVRGAFLKWGALWELHPLGTVALGYYAASGLALFYALGRRPLTARPSAG